MFIWRVTSQVQLPMVQSAAGSHSLRPGDRLITGSGEQAKMVFPDGTTVDLTGNSAVEFSSGDRGEQKLLRLERGSLSAAVAKQAFDQPMRFVTPQAEAVVRGTRLTLSHDRNTRLEVMEGEVELVRGNDRITVRSGQFAVAAAGEDLVTRVLGDTLLFFDFEDGAQPDIFNRGLVQSGPARSGNRFCLAGETQDGPWPKLQLDSGKGPPLLVYEDDLELSFDYWADGLTRSLDVFVWNETQQKAFGNMAITDLSIEHWTNVTVRLKDLYHSDQPHESIRPNDHILQLAIQAGQADGGLYIDNLTITRPEIPPAPIIK